MPGFYDGPRRPWSMNSMFWTAPDSEIQVDHIRLKSECKGCHAQCCAMDTVLYKEEVESGQYRAAPALNVGYRARQEESGERYLEKDPVTGLCVYSIEGKCSIYERRPISCKQWTCDSMGGPDYIWNMLRPADAPPKLRTPDACKTCGGEGSFSRTDPDRNSLRITTPCPECRPPPPGLLGLANALATNPEVNKIHEQADQETPAPRLS